MAWGPRAFVGVVASFVAIAHAVAIPAVAQAGRIGSSSVAALQVGLRAKGLYSGSVDGFAGPATRAAIRALQRRAGIAVDGVAGSQTLGVLGPRGRPRLGTRAIGRGARGFDVAQVQFLLAWHGFPSGAIDGGFGSHTEAAAIRFQRWAGLRGDGVVGAATIRLLQTPPRRSPVALARPLSAGISDTFGPRGNRFHPGLDFPAPTGTAVLAARGGRVTWAGWWAGGYGNLVSIAHGHGVRTLYAHLSSIAVRRGQRVSIGALIGRVGSTGLSTGPHLHFELRVRGAAIDPATAF